MQMQFRDNPLNLLSNKTASILLKDSEAAIVFHVTQVASVSVVLPQRIFSSLTKLTPCVQRLAPLPFSIQHVSAELFPPHPLPQEAHEPGLAARILTTTTSTSPRAQG